MNTWTSPTLQELDVKLTAKGAGTVEQLAHYEDGTGWVLATYDVAEGDIYSACYDPNKASVLSVS